MKASSQEASVRHRRSAFTLVELLVAAAVFGLLVLMLGQVVSLTSQAVIINVDRLTTSAQVRLFFDRLALDLSARPRRDDLATTFSKATGNDSFQFYSQVDGYSGSRHMAAVAYRVQESNPSRYYELERGAAGLNWTSGNPTSSLLFLPQSPGSPIDDNYEVLSTDIFRLEFCYLLNTGVLSNTPPPDFSTVSGIVVAVGALDGNTRKLLTPDQLQSLSVSLPDNPEGQDLVTGWDTTVTQPNFGANLPRAARGAVKIFQRTFYVR